MTELVTQQKKREIGQLESQELLLDFNPTFESLKEKSDPIELRWRDIQYTIKGRVILNKVSGICKPGSVLALMGPSGSGKTTLMNVLATRVLGNKKGKTLSGSILVNGEPINRRTFKKNLAYVAQEDLLFATATCEEAFEFSAKLRLSQEYSESERKELIEDMISSLGLAKCRHSIIGNASLRGVSGGEKKRVAIGVELLSNPRVLFLDEPTSGLDSFSAFKVLRILRAVARLNTTVICSIHQPSSEIFNEFTHLCLLTQGNLIYQGPISNIDAEFRKYGLGAPERTNLADHLILLSQTLPLDRLPRVNEMFPDDGGVVEEISTEVEVHIVDDEVKASYAAQTKELFKREYRNMIRDKKAMIAKLGMLFAQNALFIIIFQNVGDQASPSYNLPSHFGSVVMVRGRILFGFKKQSMLTNNKVITGVLIATILPAIISFPLAKPVFNREVSTATYNTVPFFVAKFLLEIPETFVLTGVTALVTYFPFKLQGDLFMYFLSLFLVCFAATSLAFIVGAFADNTMEAVELAPLALIPQVIFMGLFIRVSSIVEWLRWIQYISAAKYSLNVAAIAIFNPDNAISNSTRLQWENLAVNTEYDRSLNWLYLIMLVVLFVAFRAIAVVVLSSRASAPEG